MRKNKEIFKFELDLIENKYSFKITDKDVVNMVTQVVDEVRLFDPLLLVNGHVLPLSQHYNEFKKQLDQYANDFSALKYRRYEILGS